MQLIDTDDADRADAGLQLHHLTRKPFRPQRGSEFRRPGDDDVWMQVGVFVQRRMDHGDARH
jgi:hypothetical protein